MSGVLLGEWGFLDNLEDTSGHGHTASANFTPTYIDGPTPGTRAIRFSGTGQTITYGRTGLEPVSADGGVITMGWAKQFASLSGYCDVLHKTRADDSTRSGIDLHNDGMFFMSRWRDQPSFADTGPSNNNATWHHFVNVDSDAGYAWYRDGVLVQSGSRTGTSVVLWENFPWESGKSQLMLDTDSNVNVAISGIRIMSGSLTSIEVLDWMNTPIVPDAPERTGKPKAWSGSEWVNHPLKIWNGSAWVANPVYGYDGSDWVLSK